MASCLRKTRTVLSITKALVCRGMFTLHSLICIWRVTVIKSNVVYWSLAGTLPLVVAETVYTLYKKKNGEWKWICPSVLLYIVTSVPAIWFLELDLMTQRLVMADLTRPVAANATKEIMLLNGQIHLAINLGSEEWCKILEQMLLLILIVGRWLLPKGDITREQLSQLLLVYIGMAADIIELFEAFKEDTVRGNRLLTIIILSLWTGSLTQFTLVVTATKSKKTRSGSLVKDNGGYASCNNGARGCCPTEVLSILLSVFLQDAPFLVLRMLLIFRYDVLSYSNIFFTSKNTLVLVLQIYRLVVLFTDNPDKTSKKAKSKSIKAVISRSSGSDTCQSLTPDTYRSLSDYTFSDNTSDRSEYYPKLRKFKRRRSSFKVDSVSSFETDLKDNMPCSSKMKRKAFSASVAKRDSDSSLERRYKGKGKSPKKEARPGSFRKFTGQHEPKAVAIESGEEGEAGLKMKRKFSKKDKIKMETGNADQRQRTRRRQRRFSTEVERQVRRIEPKSRSPSPLLPPPPLPDSVSVSGDSDVGNNNNNHVSKEGPSFQVMVNGKRSGHKDSPKSSPQRVRHEDHKVHKQLHQHHDDPVNAKWHANSSKGSRARRHHWSSIKGLQSVLALLDDKGKYHTVVLKDEGNGSPVYVIDKEKMDGHNISA